MKKTMSFFTAVAGIVITQLLLIAGCKTTEVVETSEVRAVEHNPLARLEDLINLTNNLPALKKVAYFTFEMNDQTTQPFATEGQSINRRMFPMWTDADIKCWYTNDDGRCGEIIISTVMGTGGSEAPVFTNTPFVSVEIPSVYVNSSDYRFNVRIDYTKYSSIAHFLYANGMEGRTFNSLSEANTYYDGIKRFDPEYGYWYDVFRYAPKTFVVKVDFSQFRDFHSESTKINFSYNRRVGCMNSETGMVNTEEKTVWTPIFPLWVRTACFNEFAKGDVQ